MKKILALVLALAMILVVAAASAGTLTINRKSGDTYTEETTYTYYQVLKAEIGTPGSVNAETGATTGGTAAYYVDNADLKAALDTAGAGNIFKIEEVANSNPTRWNYSLLEGKTITDLLPVVSADGVLAKATKTGTFTRAANADTAVSEDLPAGYYVIKSSLGSVLATQTLNDVTINEKNEYVTLEKDVNDVIFEYGEVPEYTLKIKIPANPADKDLVVYDHMAKSLILNADITVTGTKTGADITGLKFVADTYTTPSEEDAAKYNYYQATIAKADVIANAGQTITLTYTAELNEDAIVYDWQENKAHVEYDDHSFATPEDQEKVKSLGFKVIKIDGTDKTKQLEGAEFSLWSALTEGTQIPIIKVADGKYRVAKPEEATAEGFKSAAIVAGSADIDGLDEKAYYLQEDVAPEGGYNKLTARIEVTPDKEERIEYKVENNQGTQLPSTGGIGTTIFYILGGLLVVGAAVILVARRKAQD